MSANAGVFYELRREQAKPGRGPELARWMDDVCIPVHVEAGMDVVGAFRDMDDEDGFVWIRRFAGDEERERVVQAAHAHPRFATEVLPVARDLFAGDAATTRLVPTPRSQLGLNT